MQAVAAALAAPRLQPYAAPPSRLGSLAGGGAAGCSGTECDNCHTQQTQVWRKDPENSARYLCNACGLYVSTRGSAAPGARGCARCMLAALPLSTAARPPLTCCRLAPLHPLPLPCLLQAKKHHCDRPLGAFGDQQQPVRATAAAHAPAPGPPRVVHRSAAHGGPRPAVSAGTQLGTFPPQTLALPPALQHSVSCFATMSPSALRALLALAHSPAFAAALSPSRPSADELVAAAAADAAAQAQAAAEAAAAASVFTASPSGLAPIDTGRQPALVSLPGASKAAEAAEASILGKRRAEDGEAGTGCEEAPDTPDLLTW